MVDNDTSPTIGKNQQKHIQEVLGIILWYGCCIESTIVTILSMLPSKPSPPRPNVSTQTDTGLHFLTEPCCHNMKWYTSSMEMLIISMKQCTKLCQRTSLLLQTYSIPAQQLPYLHSVQNHKSSNVLYRRS